MNIHYIGVNDATGYGISASVLMDALQKRGVKIKFTSIIFGNIENGGYLTDDETTIKAAEPFDAVIVHTVPEYFPYWYKKEKARTPGVKIWGYTTWETEDLPVYWPALLNTMDALLVPSQINKAVFEKCGINKPIYLLPHISQFKGNRALSTASSIDPLFDSLANQFIFYFIGDWNDRKAPWLIIEAFNKEFNAHENAVLVIKSGLRDWTRTRRTFKSFFRKTISLSADAFRRINQSKNKKIIHIDKVLTEDDIKTLHIRSHCFISLTRGEGWGMSSYEAAWYGKPIIITGFGGMLDYLSKENSYLIDYKLIPIKISSQHSSYFDASLWADPDSDQAAKLMRTVFNSQGEASSKGIDLMHSVRENFNAERISALCLEILLST